MLDGEPPTPAAVPVVPSKSVVRVGGRREIVLASAVSLFRRHGYHAVGVDRRTGMDRHLAALMHTVLTA